MGILVIIFPKIKYFAGTLSIPKVLEKKAEILPAHTLRRSDVCTVCAGNISVFFQLPLNWL